ncbi:MAG: LAGLIDADG family homing endonuclease, partial [Candidatus Odinarchaeota archaeon]
NYNFYVLINKRLKISKSVFNDLKTFMKVREIPHDVYIGNKKKIEIGENEEIDELIGIMLGDGHLGLDGSKFSISLNRVDEERYVEYIFNKLNTLFHDKQPKEARNSFKMIKNFKKSVEITSYSKNLHYFFVERGLVPGNKVQNQVSVPDYIFKKDKSKIRCIKGLFDTDGNAHAILNSGQLHLGFSNASKLLTEDFKIMCNDLDIITGDILTSNRDRNGTIETFYSVQIVKKDQVLKFLELIDPEKIKEPFRKIYLGARLILANSPKDLINNAKRKIEQWNRKNNQKRLIYTKKNAIFLRKLCEKLFKKNKIMDIYGIRFNGKLTNDMFEIAIKKALSYPPNNLNLKKSNKEIFSFPRILRNKLCKFLFKNLSINSTSKTNDQLILLVKKEINRLKFQDIYDAINDTTYKDALIKYLESLIFLIRYIVHLSKNSIPIFTKQVYEKIDENPKWKHSLSYDIVREIINYLKKIYPNYLEINYIELNNIINYLKVHKRATKQQIAHFIGKGFRAAYNKLIELEKDGIVRRNRKKIGTPTYWYLTSEM